MLQNVEIVQQSDVAVVLAALDAMKRHDWQKMYDLLEPDAIWTLPGTSSVSGVATGAAAVVERAQIIAGANLTSQPLHVHVGYQSIVATVHNTAETPVHLDEYLALVFTVRGGKIAVIDTHLTDVPMLERFYAALAS